MNGLQVNVGRQGGGAGNSNCGNTARECFSNLDTFVDILKIYPHDLVEDLKVLIEVLDCGDPIDPEAFRTFCDSWLDRFHDPELGLDWHWLSPTMHLLMHHGADIVSLFPCAPGLMSEEGSEANVKYFRHFRSHHASKHSSKNLQQCFLRQHHIADPVIQDILAKPQPGGHKKPLSLKAASLIAPLESYDYLEFEPSKLSTIEESDEDEDCDLDMDI